MTKPGGPAAARVLEVEVMVPGTSSSAGGTDVEVVPEVEVRGGGRNSPPTRGGKKRAKARKKGAGGRKKKAAGRKKKGVAAHKKKAAK